MLLLPLLLSLLFVASAIIAVAACISDTCVSCPLQVVVAEVIAADDETDDGSACAGAHDISGSQLRCAQLRPLGIPMGLPGNRQRPSKL